MSKPTLILIALSVTMACSDKIVEPVAIGDYYVTNNSGASIILEADVQLLQTSVEPDQHAKIYSFAEASGGHVRPSNGLNSFVIYSGSVSPSNIIYSGVDDDDWIDEGKDNSGHFVYHLIVQ